MVPRFAVGDQVLWRGQLAVVDDVSADYRDVMISIQMDGRWVGFQSVLATTLAMHQRVWVLDRCDYRWRC
jgi:hypothetical protein